MSGSSVVSIKLGKKMIGRTTTTNLFSIFIRFVTFLSWFQKNVHKFVTFLSYQIKNVHTELFCKWQNFRLLQIESICRQQSKCETKSEISFGKGRKHYGKSLLFQGHQKSGLCGKELILNFVNVGSPVPSGSRIWKYCLYTAKTYSLCILVKESWIWNFEWIWFRGGLSGKWLL